MLPSNMDDPFYGLPVPHEPVSSLTHLLAVPFILFFGYFLWKKGRGSALRSSSLLVFIGSLLFLFSMSGIYHGLAPGPWRTFFRRLDYAGIGVVIAGTVTPVHILLLKGRWRWGLLSLIWGLALACLFLIDLYFEELPFGAIVAGYLALGWLGSLSFYKVVQRFGLKKALTFFLAGISYTAGALIDWLEAPDPWPGVWGHHELFHLLVMVGAFLSWSFIYESADKKVPRARSAWRAIRSWFTKLRSG